VTAALHEAAHCAPSLTVQVDVGSPKSSFSSTDLPELLQDTDSDRGHWEETGHLHTRSPHHGQGVTLPLTCPPSANARDSRDLHPPGAGTPGRVETCLRGSGATTPWKPAPARGRKPGSCSPPQTHSVGHLDLGATWWGPRTRSRGQTGRRGRALGPGTPGLAQACRCRVGFTRSPQAFCG